MHSCTPIQYFSYFKDKNLSLSLSSQYSTTTSFKHLKFQFPENMMTFLAKVSIFIAIVGFGLSCLKAWMQGPKCLSKRRLDGKVVVITGANTGIGKECAKELSRRGAKVIMLVRSLERGEVAAREIRGEGREIIVEKMDLSSFNSIRECASKLNIILDKIDILLNNAGVMACPLSRTIDRLEMQIGTNHFGHFLLTNLLLPLLRKGGPGTRVVTVSSIAHTSGKQFNEFEQLTNHSELNHQVIFLFNLHVCICG